MKSFAGCFAIYDDERQDIILLGDLPLLFDSIHAAEGLIDDLLGKNKRFRVIEVAVVDPQQILGEEPPDDEDD